MIEVVFKYKGEKIVGKLPEGWHELTVRQWLALEDIEERPLAMLAVLLETDLEKIENAEANLTPLLNKVAEIFNTKPPEFDKPTEKGVIIQGKRLRFPKNLNKLLFGQLLEINQLLENKEELNQNLTRVAAIVLQPQIDGVYKSERVPEVAELVARSRAVDVFGDLFFFAQKVKRYARDMRALSRVFQ